MGVLPPFHVLGYAYELSLAVSLWVGEMSTGDGYDQYHRRGRNDEFCVKTVGPLPNCWHTRPGRLKALADNW